MLECSVFADESGDTGSDSEFYLLTLVFHNQSENLEGAISSYEQRLRDAGLPNIPFHMEPLMAQERDYANMSIPDRSKLLSYFHEFAVHCPIRHKTFVYDKKEFGRRDKRTESGPIASRLSKRMEKDISEFAEAHLAFFQKFDTVRVYYDDGQPEVSRALRRALSSKLAKSSFERKPGVDYHDYRLAQIADMLCGFAFLDLKFKRGMQTSTDLRFADDHKNLRKRYLKKIGRLELK